MTHIATARSRHGRRRRTPARRIVPKAASAKPSSRGDRFGTCTPTSTMLSSPPKSELQDVEFGKQVGARLGVLFCAALACSSLCCHSVPPFACWVAGHPSPTRWGFRGCPTGPRALEPVVHVRVAHGFFVCVCRVVVAIVAVLSRAQRCVLSCAFQVAAADSELAWGTQFGCCAVTSHHATADEGRSRVRCFR